MPVSATISEAKDQLPAISNPVFEAALMPSETEMKLLRVPFSNKQLNEAGRIVSAAADQPLVDSHSFDALQIVEQWRLSHAYPLRAVTWILSKHAKVFDPRVTVSSRMKRMTSIAAKLRRQSTMQLTTMNDVGGCRAILGRIEQVSELTKVVGGDLKEKLGEPTIYDYIQDPKEDGYRSIHLAMRFRSKKPEFKDFPVRRIEIQIRSRMQHAWATAVETVDFFDRQNLKLGGGDTRWKRFFALASDMFARGEGCPTVPGVQPNPVDELRYLWHDLDVLGRLSAWATTLQHTEKANANDVYVLIETDIKQMTIKTAGWKAGEVKEASAEYAQAEQRTAEDPRNRGAVLTTADSLAELRRAYPSYFGDTTVFLARLRNILGDWR